MQIEREKETEKMEKEWGQIRRLIFKHIHAWVIDVCSCWINNVTLELWFVLMTSLPVSNHVSATPFSSEDPCSSLCVLKLILCQPRVCVWCVCIWLRERTHVCLPGADGWPSVEGRVGVGLLLLWQVNVDTHWIQMRVSPSFFFPRASSFLCLHGGMY